MMNRIIQGDVRDVLKTLPSGSVDCVVTSPPYYGLRDYGVEGQIGLEENLQRYVGVMQIVFSEVRRILKPEGTMWLNLGDSYSAGGRGGSERNQHGVGLVANEGRPKNLMGVPWKVAFALQDEGWNLRSDIIWHKPNAMPESVTDRPTKSHEYLFLMTKSEKYYYDADAIKEKASRSDEAKWSSEQSGLHSAESHEGTGQSTRRFGADPDYRNKRTVWTVATRPYPEAHFATFPKELIEPCIVAGSPKGGRILDPFCGSGTTGVVALERNREFLGIELNPEYIKLAEKRMKEITPCFGFME